MEDLKDIVTNIGAFAGFAAVVGLAVLAMLYFSQARDVRRLREWAGRAPERDADVEQIASQIASRAIADMYAAMPAATGTESVAEAEPPQQEAASVPEEGVEPPIEGEPQPTEWTSEQPAESEVAPTSEPIDAIIAGEALEPNDAEGESEPAGPSSEPAVAASVSQPTEEVNVLELEDELGESPETRPSRLAPSTPAAARAGLAPEPPASAQPTGPRPPLPPLDEYRSTAAESIGTGLYSTTAPPHETTFSEFELERNREEQRSQGSRLPFYIAGVLVLAFGLLLVYTQVGGDSGNETVTTQQSEADRRKATGSNPRINRPAVQVVVLNGTSISGLAAVVGDQVDQAGFTLKSVANRGDNQDYIESIVYYAPGKKLEAEEVAKELQIDTIKEVDEGTAAAGGNAPVIVVTGSDREQ